MYLSKLHRLNLAFPHFILLLSLLWIVVAPVVIAALVVTPIQAAGIAWYDGLIQYSNIINCASIIQGAPYSEKGVGTYLGFLSDPETRKPAPNEVYYVHIVIAGLGNACSGMRAYIDIGLPANTTLAIDATNKVFCFYNNTPVTPVSACPQSPPASPYTQGMYQIPSADTANGNTWPVSQGQFLEIQIPVRSSTTLSNSQMQAKVWILDGNDSPWLQPQQGIYVFSNQQAILYPSPSTTSIESTTAHSEAYLYSNGEGGTGYFDLGTDTSYSLIHEAVAIPDGWYATLAWDDWGPPALLPDTLYHWRFTFTSSSGQTTYGTDQTFQTLPDGTVTVGTGITGSCTEAAFNSALTIGEKVTFACGPLPEVITLTGPKTITNDVIIDGGNMVTLSTDSSTNHFIVQAFGHLFLNQIKLEDGWNSSSCGGSVHVLGNGQLTTIETTFNGNISEVKGGAVCVDANGSADIHSTTFTNNQAWNGGAIFNEGSIVVDHSVFATNTAFVHGGGLQNYGIADLVESTFNQNSAGTNGGGIDDIGVLYLTNDDFTGNIAGVRGGAINEYTGTMIVADSKFTGNHSGGYGGGIANDIGTVTISASEISGNTAVSVGGGMRSNGITNIMNSTFSGNNAGTNGGAIENSENSGTLLLLNTTLTSNTAGVQGGNIYIGSITSDHVKIKNTLIASGSPNNCDNPVLSEGSNLESANSCGLVAAGDKVNTDPKLGPLQNNGGPVNTHALLSGSPAMDTGLNVGCPPFDARGVTRPKDSDKNGVLTCDIGAYEYDPETDLIMLYLPVIRK